MSILGWLFTRKHVEGIKGDNFYTKAKNTRMGIYRRVKKIPIRQKISLPRGIVLHRLITLSEMLSHVPVFMLMEKL